MEEKEEKEEKEEEEEEEEGRRRAQTAENIDAYIREQMGRANLPLDARFVSWVWHSLLLLCSATNGSAQKRR